MCFVNTFEKHSVLVLFAHPNIRKSRVNRALVESLRGVDGVTVNDLYERYPDFDIDVQREQHLLETHDFVVFQHPFYWYSTPSILKEWQDLVLEHGWAYGHDGNALRGKVLLSAITAGGSEEAYGTDGGNQLSVSKLLAPIAQTAALCGMEYLPPFVVYGTHLLTDDGIGRHAKDYRRLIKALRNGRVSGDSTKGLDRINQDLAMLLGG